MAHYAEKLAEKYGVDKDKAAIAGLLHDVTKETPESEQLEIIKKDGIILSPLELHSPKLLHSISGAAFAKNALGIINSDVLDAIRYHTTARENMSALEKIIFVADFISDDRDWNDAEFLRNLAFKNLDDAAIYGLKITIQALLDRDALIAENTIKAYNDIMLKR